MDLGKIETLISGILEQENAELVDWEYLNDKGRWVLRIFIDKEPGVTLDDCEYFSDRVGSALDATDLMERAYVLEVSSPGIDRLVKKDKDFERFAGRGVRVSLNSQVEGRRHLRGRLLGLKDGDVAVEAEGRTWRLPRKEVAEVRIDAEAEVEADLKRTGAGKRQGKSP